MIQKKKQTILILAGEASGEMHGAGLVSELKKRRSDLTFFGIGGDQMVKEGVEILHHVREMAFLGFFEVIRHLPLVRRIFRELSAEIQKRKPVLAILIDYPGFNLRFAREAKKHGIPVVYYISPQVWAWGKRRVKKMARLIDRMIVIFPFEENIYEKEGMDVQYVGHPLKDNSSPKKSRKAFFHELGLDSQKPILGILPGSRIQEIRKLFPEMRKAYSLLQKKIPGLQAILGLAPTISDQEYRLLLNPMANICPIRNRTKEIISYSDVVLVASGTATLETAIQTTPMVVLYRMSNLSYLIGRLLVRLKHISLVNILAGREVVPELIQKRAKGETIANEAWNLFSDKNRRTRMKKDLKEVNQKLGNAGATKRAAKAVAELLERIA